MLLHAFVPASRANGPGLRAVVYFRGCSLNCPGCWNPDSHKFQGDDVPPASVIREIQAAMGRRPLEGLTFSGGEPMQQVQALVALMSCIRAGAPAASMGMFSGYTEAELQAGLYVTRPRTSTAERRELWHIVRSHLDFALMGRYDRKQPGIAPLRTSRNQALVLFTRRYDQRDFTEQLVEVGIDQDGKTVLTGFPVLGNPAV